MIRGQKERIKGASFQMQRQLLCPPIIIIAMLLLNCLEAI
tara:strand:+ start:581 stop:700 length:120 start_codon:yes stop_codon:yes gene_type:complete